MELITKIEKEVQTGSVAEYSETTARLSELKEKYGSEVPDASTPEGYKRAKQIAKEMTSLRTSLDAIRKQFKSPVLALGELIDSEAKSITKEILSIEIPFKSAYQSVDAAKKAAKEAIENRISEIKGMADKALLASGSDEVEQMISDLAEEDISKERFGRKVDEVAGLVAVTLEVLSSVHAQKIEQEQEKIKVEKEREELEELRALKAERDERDRIEEERLKQEAYDSRVASDAAERAIQEERARFSDKKHILKHKEYKLPEIPQMTIPHECIHEITAWAIDNEIDPEVVKELEIILKKYF